jgi:hypothetical protein
MHIAIAPAAPDSFAHAAAFSLFALIIALNGIWMIIKLELWSNGHRGWLPKADVREFKLHSDRQTSPSKRLPYNVIYYAWHERFILLFVAPLLFLGIGYFLSHAH